MKVTLIGCGIWGSLILKDLLYLGIDVSVIDPNSDHLKSALELGACEGANYIKDVTRTDGIIVATPASTHLEIIKELDAEGNRAPIFCEKPLAHNAVAAKALLNRASTAPPIFVMHIWRYHSGVRKLKELYLEGLIGELTQIRTYRANWTSPRDDVDAINNLAPHDLSIFQFIHGSLPEVSAAVSERIEGKIVGCLGILNDEKSPHCIFEVSNRYGEKRREIRLHGTTGVLVLPDDRSGVIQWIRGAGFIVPKTIEKIPYSKESALRAELSTFIDYLQNGDSSELCSVSEGVSVCIRLDELRQLSNTSPQFQI